MRLKQFLCPPVYYDVVYSINPWMNPSVPVDKDLAWEQWRSFVAILNEADEELVFVSPQANCPDMVFLGDAGIVTGDRFLCSRFRHPEREPEAEHYAKWFEGAGYKVERTPPGAILEGLGDVTTCGQKAILGHGPRSSAEGFEALRRFMPSLRVIAEVELPDPRFYHLAMAIAFLDQDTLLYYPKALTAASIRKLEQAVPNLVAVGDDDIFLYQACNCVVLGDLVVLDGCSPALASKLSLLGYRVRYSPCSEFKKGGGSLRCLILPSLAPLGATRASDPGTSTGRQQGHPCASFEHEEAR